MRVVFAILLISTALAAQNSNRAKLVDLTRELRTAIQNDSLESAMDIATKLDDAVHAKYQSWLVRDSGERVEEVLSWLPPDTESFWVNREPCVLDRVESVELLNGRPTQEYSLDRLIALNDGSLYSHLTGRTLRLVMAATRGTKSPAFDVISVPRGMPQQDVAYFYFFAEPVDLPPPDESIQGVPVWQGSAIGNTEGIAQSGAPRNDANWIALARPDSLILTNKKELLDEILGRVARGSKTRALPASLPEWTQTDNTAPFWGLRHYTAQSRPKPGERGCEAAQLPEPDCHATGVAVRFDTKKERLEIRYLSETQPAQSGAPDSMLRQFQIDEAQTGVLRLVADVEHRGPFPMHFAMVMLGFGLYR